MEVTHITSNPRIGKLGTVNEDDDDDDVYHVVDSDLRYLKIDCGTKSNWVEYNH